jgi:hypothetical protein
MAENPDNKSIKSDEVDLLDLFRRIGHGISVILNTLGKWIIISIVFLIRNWLYLSVSLIIGVALSFLAKKISKEYYISEMFISSNTVPADEMITYIDKLHRFSIEGNTSSLSSSLGLDIEKTKGILDIESFWIIDNGNDKIPDYVDYSVKFNVYDTLNSRMSDRLAIRIKTTLPGNLPEVRDGIFHYIESNQYFEEQNKLRLSQLDELINRAKYDLQQLDSLQKIKYYEETKNRIPEKGGQMVFLQEQKTQLILDEIYGIYRNKQRYEKDKELYSGIATLLNDFTMPALPKNGILIYAKTIIPLFMCFAIIVLILIQNRKRIAEAFKKY